MSDEEMTVLAEDSDSEELEYDARIVKDDPDLRKHLEEKNDGDDLFALEDAEEGVEFMAVKPWLGAIKEPSNPPKYDSRKPDVKPVLEWAHGYRGYDARDNVFYNTRGEIIYPTASVVVTYDPVKHEQKHFIGHNDDVISFAQNPVDRDIVASGQKAWIDPTTGRSELPYICVYNTVTQEKWKLPKRHKRSVRTIAFSPDGKYLASVGDDDYHTVMVWDWQEKELICSQKGDSAVIFDLQWNRVQSGRNYELMSAGKKHAKVWTFDGASLKGQRCKFDKYPIQTFYSITYSAKGFACVGGRDGSVVIFRGSKIVKWVKKVLPGSVYSIYSVPETADLIVGGKGGIKVLNNKLKVSHEFDFGDAHVRAVSVRYRDSKTQDLVVGTKKSQIYHVKNFTNVDSGNVADDHKPVVNGHFDGETWALEVFPDGDKYVTAGEDNQVCLWSVEGHKLVRTGVISEKAGKRAKKRQASTMSSYPTNQMARAIAIHPRKPEVIIGKNNGWVTVLDAETLEIKKELDLNKYSKRQVTGQKENWIETISFSPNGRTVAVGTHGICVVLLDSRNYSVKGTLKASNAAPTHLDWSSDSTRLQTVDKAYELLYFEIDQDDLKSSSQNTSATSMKDTEWATHHCTFGWPVQGIRDSSQGGDDVNDVDVSPSRRLIVTGDDYGKVNLFRYPQSDESQGGHHIMTAHSSHVMRVRFTPDERRLVTVGGNDRAIMQWTLE